MQARQQHLNLRMLPCHRSAIRSTHKRHERRVLLTLRCRLHASRETAPGEGDGEGFNA